MSVVLITGARGQLGSHIAEQLREAGRPVRALVRPGRDCSLLQHLGVELLEGDLNDPEALHRALRGVSVVYHCAARVTDWGPWADFERDTLTPTRNVVEACRRAEVARLLHISSISAYGHPRAAPGETITEDAPLGQGLSRWDYYPYSKFLAEKIAREFPRTTVVRPSWIYGPRDRATIPRLVPALLAGRVPIIGRGDNLLNIIYAADVATGAILAADHPAAVGQAYNLSSRGEVTQRDLLNTLTDALGLPRIRKRVPYFLALRFAQVQQTLAWLLRRTNPPTVTPRAIYLVGRSTRFSIEKARMQLGWQPRTPVDEGVRRALEGYFGRSAGNGRLQRCNAASG